MVKLFGVSHFLDLPPIGATLKKNQIGVLFGRYDNTAGVKSPVTGTVLRVNQKVYDNPGIPHEDPYHKGWLLVLEPDMP
ncbi:MAG: glycine cleavage system protein H, partial [Deltaproteobacteria bacterium]|nr:glycine cleavage system protein H [Deltaproteobacteria bacterium]